MLDIFLFLPLYIGIFYLLMGLSKKNKKFIYRGILLILIFIVIFLGIFLWIMHNLNSGRPWM